MQDIHTGGCAHSYFNQASSSLSDKRGNTEQCGTAEQCCLWGISLWIGVPVQRPPPPATVKAGLLKGFKVWTWEFNLILKNTTFEITSFQVSPSTLVLQDILGIVFQQNMNQSFVKRLIRVGTGLYRLSRTGLADYLRNRKLNQITIIGIIWFTLYLILFLMV